MRETITISQTAWLNLCLISQGVASNCAASLPAIVYLTLCHRVLKRGRGGERGGKKAKFQLCFLLEPRLKRDVCPACQTRAPELLQSDGSPQRFRSAPTAAATRAQMWMNHICLFHLSQRLPPSLPASSGSNRVSTAKTHTYSDLIRLEIFTCRTPLFLMV